MIALFCFALAVLASPFKSKLRLEAENAVLRHQLIVFAAQAAWSRPIYEPGSLVPDPAVSLVFPNPAGSHHHPARDAGALAQGRFSLLLALEVAISRRPTADRHRVALIDPTDEHGESAVGRAAHSRRTA